MQGELGNVGPGGTDGSDGRDVSVVTITPPILPRGTSTIDGCRQLQKFLGYSEKKPTSELLLTGWSIVHTYVLLHLLSSI